MPHGTLRNVLGAAVPVALHAVLNRKNLSNTWVFANCRCWWVLKRIEGLSPTCRTDLLPSHKSRRVLRPGGSTRFQPSLLLNPSLLSSFGFRLLNLPFFSLEVFYMYRPRVF